LVETMPCDIESITKRFQICSKFLNAEPYGSGHVNDTYLVTFEHDGSRVGYIFQRINKSIFRNPAALMENIVRVTEHIHCKLQKKNISDISRRVLTVIRAQDECSYYMDAEGNYWRAYLFVTKAHTYDVLESGNQAYQAARVFGLFQEMLVDLPEPPLNETIPDFHNGPKRFGQFKQALEADICNRAKNAKAEIEFLVKQGWIFDILPDLLEKGQLQLRTTHNDTKINNVMFDDETGEGVCVIDLDTVMPGLSLYDFGDIVRSATSPASEDERDLSKVFMDMTRFRAIVEGYLSAAAEFLNDVEREHLVHGGKMLTLIMGTRFLTDYLVGDKYYKTHREGHNLDRCRTQFKLVRCMIEQEEEMRALVERI